ncbi:MAG: energy transducer TonB [Terracidiphilus sp.]
MRRALSVALFFSLTTGASGGQQTAPISFNPLDDAPPEPVKVYSPGPGVRAPELLPLNLPPFGKEKCDLKQDGKVLLSLLVDTKGRPRNIMFLKPLGTEADRFAIHIASSDLFDPGRADGKPVVVAESLEIGIESCLVESLDSAGKKSYSLRLMSLPTQKLEALPKPPDVAVLAPVDDPLQKNPNVGSRIYKLKPGDGIIRPVALNSPDVQFTNQAEVAGRHGVCIISLIVDANGMPQNSWVEKPLSAELTGYAMQVINKTRFKPAMKDGEPVAVEIAFEENFQL